MNAEVNRAAFRSLMEDFFGFHDPILTGNMFDSMDKDGGGLIDFKELLSGLSMALRGSPQQVAKLQYIVTHTHTHTERERERERERETRQSVVACGC